MKAQTKLFGLLVTAVVCLAPSPASADRAPAPAEAAQSQTQLGLDALHQAACLGKLPKQLCDLERGGAGTCLPVKSPEGRGVLQCSSAANGESYEQGPILMLTFGVLVAVIGGFFWWRLKKNWGKT